MSYKIKNMDQYAKLDPLIFKHDLKWEGKTAIISFLVFAVFLLFIATRSEWRLLWTQRSIWTTSPWRSRFILRIWLILMNPRTQFLWMPLPSKIMYILILYAILRRLPSMWGPSMRLANTLIVMLFIMTSPSPVLSLCTLYSLAYPIFCRLSYMLADTTYSGLTFGHETIDNVDSHYSYSCRAKCLIHNYKLDIEL